MARAHSIWLVVWHAYDGVEVRAAFTVKHELVSYLERQPTDALIGCSVMRLPDGDIGAHKEYDVKSFLRAVSKDN